MRRLVSLDARELWFICHGIIMARPYLGLDVGMCSRTMLHMQTDDWTGHSRCCNSGQHHMHISCADSEAAKTVAG